nr:class V chitinase-like [Malus domestica]
MLGIPSNRKSFIESSIELARCYFQGIDLLWPWLNTALDMINMEKLLDEWRAAVTSEARNTGLSRLKLTMSSAFEENVTGAHAALYDPFSYLNTDYGIRQWLNYSFPASKLVLGLPYHGYAWIVAKNLKTLHLALL